MDAFGCRITADRADTAPASLEQQAILRSIRDGRGAGDPVSIRLDFRGRLDVTALRAAWSRLVQRHEILRTTFGRTGDEDLQIVASSQTSVQLLEEPLDHA